MAQLIVLLEKDFKNTYFTSKNIIVSHVLKSSIKTACKPIKIKNTKDLNNDGDLINNRRKRTSKKIACDDNNDSDKFLKKNRNMAEPGMASSKINEDAESDSGPDPFGDNSDDDLALEVSDFKKNEGKTKIFVTENSTNLKIKEESDSDETEYLPEEELDDEEPDDEESDLDWGVKRPRSKKRNKQDDNCDPNKLTIQKLIKDASHYFCTICEAKIETAEKITHRRSHNLRYLSYQLRLQCPSCSFVCYHSNGFKIHYQRYHSNEGGIFEWKKCTECPYKTTQSTGLRHHLTRHNQNGTFKCQYCSFSHDHKKNLTRHLRLHNKFLTGLFRCEVCPYASKHSSSLWKHKVLYHTPEEQRKFGHCKECPFKALALSNLKKHIKSHELTDGYGCPHCTYRSPYACRITDHIKVHYAKGEPIPDYDPKLQTPLHFCTKCSYKTMSKTHLDRHLTSHQTYHDRKLSCAECPFTCKDKIDLVGHVKYHNGRGELKCPWCSYSHFSQPMMTRHKRLHNDEREEVEKTKNRRNGEEPRCPICNVLFKSKSFVQRHMTKHQTIDQVSNPFMCAHCPYKSKTKCNSFINHIQCHFKSEGMKCEFCTFRHDRSNVMTTHTKLHKDAPVKTELQE